MVQRRKQRLWLVPESWLRIAKVFVGRVSSDHVLQVVLWEDCYRVDLPLFIVCMPGRTGEFRRRWDPGRLRDRHRRFEDEELQEQALVGAHLSWIVVPCGLPSHRLPFPSRGSYSNRGEGGTRRVVVSRHSACLLSDCGVSDWRGV